MLVYRSSSQQHSSAEVVAALEAALARCLALKLSDSPGSEDPYLDCLLRAGELECAAADLAAADHNWIEQARTAAAITDAAAAASLGDASRLADARRLCQRLHLPARVALKPAEGFAFYALHPRLYARLLAQSPSQSAIAVVGIRSIGTTLSAVVAAAARAQGQPAERITVRPTGHPYDREVTFDEAQRAWVAHQFAGGERFIVVDEGPGRSGSSLLATAEALQQCGVANQRITIFCSHRCDPATLLARDAAARWSRFRALAPQQEWLPLPKDADIEVSAGRWREHLLSPGTPWPATWTPTERLKFLSRDGRWLMKFEGYGRFGAAALARAKAVHRAGFGPAVEDAGNGFLRYARLRRPPAVEQSLSPTAKVIDRLASYCAFRAREFPASHLDVDGSVLREMVACNLREEFQLEPPPLTFECVLPTICDSRMQPHEWLLTSDGELLKTDATSHGDDHFYPGPCDIAWDLAGCIIEWNMDAAATEALLAEYGRLSGDAAQRRIRDYLLAYSAFRMGWMKMAADSCASPDERARIFAEYQRYRTSTQTILGRFSEELSPAAAHFKIGSSSRRSAVTSTPA
jgi:hypothetical protein